MIHFLQLIGEADDTLWNIQKIKLSAKYQSVIKKPFLFEKRIKLKFNKI